MVVTHLDASSTSVALIWTPSPSSKEVSLPTTTIPPFIVPKAGRQRRVTVEGGDDPFINKLPTNAAACSVGGNEGSLGEEEQASHLQALLGISMAGHNPSLRSSGGL